MDFSQFRAALVELGADLDKSAQHVVSQMANVGLNVTKKNTPIGDYSGDVYFITEWGKPVHFKVHSGKVGGTLRRGWKKTATHKEGNDWVSGFNNNVVYAIYINNGHRVVSRWGETTGFVKGKRMLEQGIDAAKQQTESIFNNEIAKVKAKGGW